MKKFTWVAIMLLLPVMCSAGRNMIWDKYARDLLMNSDGSINVVTDGEWAGAEAGRQTVSFNYSTAAFTMYGVGGDTATAINGISIYITGGATTSYAAYKVYASSIRILTEGGLKPGVTIWDLTQPHIDTLTELTNYMSVIDTNTIGFEGGITIATTAATNGVILSNLLTETSTATFLGVANIKTLTVTPDTSHAVSYGVYTSSIWFITTGGLYPGTSIHTLTEKNKDTLDELVTYLSAIPATTPGVEGGIVAVRAQGMYGSGDSTELASVAVTSFIGSANTASLDLNNVQGIQYVLPASGLDSGQRYILQDVCVGYPVFSSGVLPINIYDGTGSTDTQLRRETIILSGVDAPMDFPPGTIYGTEDGALTIIIKSASTYITDGTLNITIEKR